MAIIIEGPDNSGKSTLARIVAKRFGLQLIESEGPPRYPGELIHRIERYNALPRPLFVRHPCVSQPIYSRLRKERSDGIPTDMLTEFYNTNHFFIYCDPGNRGMSGHVEKEGIDTLEHLRAVHENYVDLLIAYRKWALTRADLLFRIGDNIDRVLRVCSTVI